NSQANVDVVLATNHVERVRDREHICPACERRKPSVANRPVPLVQANVGQTTTKTSTGSLGDALTAAGGIKIRIGNAGANFRSLACAAREGMNQVKDSVVPKCKLVDVAVGEYVGLRNGGVSR